MSEIRNIPAQGAVALLRDGATLIDVREPDEFRAGHIPQALSIPLGQIGPVVSAASFPPDRPIITQCLKGGRGAQACAVLGGLNLPNPLYNLDGGIGGWEAAGLPVISSGARASSGVSLFRQVQIIVGLLVVAGVIAGLSGIAVGFYAAGFFGFMLAFAGITGWCGLAMLLAKAPWNR